MLTECDTTIARLDGEKRDLQQALMRSGPSCRGCSDPSFNVIGEQRYQGQPSDAVRPAGALPTMQ